MQGKFINHPFSLMKCTVDVNEGKSHSGLLIYLLHSSQCGGAVAASNLCFSSKSKSHSWTFQHSVSNHICRSYARFVYLKEKKVVLLASVEAGVLFFTKFSQGLFVQMTEQMMIKTMTHALLFLALFLGNDCIQSLPFQYQLRSL